MPVESEVIEKKSKKPIIFMAIIAVLVIAVIAIIFVIRGNGKSGTSDLSRIELGNKYLDEFNYEMAIATFEEAIEIDPMSVEAYVGLAYAYIGMNDFESALEWAEKGYEMTGDQSLKNMIDMIKSGNIIDASGLTHKETRYDGDGNILSWFEYTYINGRVDLIKRYTPDGVMRHSIQCEYDDNGRQIVGRYSWSDNNMTTGYYEYDSEGKCLSVTSVNEDGSFDRKMEYIYENGQRIRENIYFPDENALGYYSEYEYGDGYEKDTNYRGDGSLIGYSIFTGNEHERKQESYNEYGELESVHIENYDTGEYTSYDADGNVIGYTIYQ